MTGPTISTNSLAWAIRAWFEMVDHSCIVDGDQKKRVWRQKMDELTEEKEHPSRTFLVYVWQAPGASLQLPARGNVTWQFHRPLAMCSYYLAISWRKSVWEMQMAINSCEFCSPLGAKFVFFNNIICVSPPFSFLPVLTFTYAGYSSSVLTCTSFLALLSS